MATIDLKVMTEENFVTYAGMVIQKRALVDVRDCLKPSARELMYAQYIDKIDWKHKYQKSLKSVGSGTSHFYVHGDTSAYGVLIRMGKPFAMRYMLEDVNGNAGTMTANGNEASSRYTEMRLAPICANLFDSIDKNSIELWFDNYDNTEIYPSVFPSLGFYNIVNGTMGIGVALASSIPQFNLNEVNDALIKLLNDPDAKFEDLYCAPDFATGAIVINEDEVKESLKNGRGKACKMRARIEYVEKDNCLVVTEIPFGVYTDNICVQIAKMCKENPLCGIDKCVDRTKTSPEIKIFLTKKANVNKVVKELYANTDLESYFGINMTMLDNGTSPRVFTWKEALQAHLNHEKEVLTRSLEYDKQKYSERLNIVEGLLIALARIEEVIAVIKGSADGATAKKSLITEFGLNEAQAKAILDIKLVRLANLEQVKVENEKYDLLAKIEEINHILSTPADFNKIIEDKLLEVKKKYGDARRTEIQNISFDDEEEEPVEKKELIVCLTDKGNLYTEEKTTLMVQRRGGKGSRIKVAKNENIIDTIADLNTSSCLAFSDKGKVYSINMSKLPVNGKINCREIFEIEGTESITRILAFNKMEQYTSIIFTTKNGLVKKSNLSEYRIRKGKGIIAVKLKDGDSLVGVHFAKSEPLGFLTKEGKSIIIDLETISATGRATSGSCGIKLNEGDEVICTQLIPSNTKHIFSISSLGIAKKIPYSECGLSNRATKGTYLQKLKDNDTMAYFLPLTSEDKNITLISTSNTIKISLDEISEVSRMAQGVMAKKMNEREKIIKVVL